MTEDIGQALETERPLLSICIPNYNRVDWLTVSLRALMPQICALGGAVELCVADNCSAEDAPAVVAAARASGPITFHRHEANLGPFPNCLHLVEKMATGRYVWLIGNDDIVRAGAVARIVAALRAHPDVAVLYASYLTWTPDRPGGVLDDPDRVSATESRGSAREDDHGLARVQDLLAYDENCLTPACCCVLRREDAVAMYRDSVHAKAWATLEATLPPPVYIARRLLQEPAWYLGEPCIVVNVESTWGDYLPRFGLELVPDLLDRFDAGGADSGMVDAVRRHWIRSASSFISAYWGRALLNRKPLPDAARVSVAHYLWRFKRYPELWRALAQAPLLLAARLLPMDARNSLRRARALLQRAFAA